MKNKATFRPLGRFLRDTPIRQKLILIIMATTMVTLVLAGIGIIVADFILFRGNLKNDLAALSHIIADNTTAPLSFDDPKAAAETLATLHSRAQVRLACVFSADGRLFAKYVRADLNMECPTPRTGEDIRFEGGVLSVSRPILLDGHQLGDLVLVYGLGEVYERIQLYTGMVIGVFLLSTVIAFFLSARLRSLVTTPIIDLARVTSRVSDSRDYGIRARKFSGDEMGVLVDAFNEMLASIQSRESELRAALLTRESALEDAQQARDSLETTLDNVAQLNGELRRSNESLARSNEDLERFAFIASHDLQEPLRMISIYSQLLARRRTAIHDPQIATFIENIESGTRRMRELLADLLAYAEMGAQFDEVMQEVDLNLVLEKVRENLAFAIAESGATISAARLPVVRGFESHFTPLLQNLISNAIKYRSDKKPIIDIAGGHVDGFLQVCVADNGIGISSEYFSKIFVAFKRLHGKQIPGTGIGLAICQRVVERYGGRIWVESEVGQGSNFIFTLPVNLLVT